MNLWPVIARRVCVVATFVLLLSPFGIGSGSSLCSFQYILASYTILSGAAVPIVIPDGCDPVSFGSGAILLNASSVTLRSNSYPVATVDTGFATKSVLAPGAKLTLERLRLRNARLELAPVLRLAAFAVKEQHLFDVTVETDCQTLSALTNSVFSGATGGRGYLQVDTYNSGGFEARSVNFTCDLPSFGAQTVEVATDLQLLNALVASQLPQPEDPSSKASPVILLTASISLSPDIWRPSLPVSVTRNVTVTGRRGVFTVLDFQGIVNMVKPAPGVIISLDNLYVMNAGPLRGGMYFLGPLPLFSIPVWFFNFTRIPNSPQVTMTNVTLGLTQSEYDYFVMWSVLATTEVGHVNEAVAGLRATTPIIKLNSKSLGPLNFEQLKGTGLDMYNLTLTPELPPVPYSVRVLDNPINHFGISLPTNLTQLPVYDLGDLMYLLGQMSNLPQHTPVALFILTNITIDPTLWPADGYFLSQPLLLVGYSNVRSVTWINFQRVPYFVRLGGCPTSHFVYTQGLHLVNLPNGLLLEGRPQVAGAGLNDVSVYMSNFQTTGSACLFLFLNQSAVVVTYAEFKRVYGAVSKSLGTSNSGSGSVLNSNFSYNLSTVLWDNIVFVDVVGWGWKGYKVNLTYNAPEGVQLMYNNAYDPPAPPEGSAKSDGGGLEAWQVALIVIGCVVFVALLVGLIALRVVSRLRHEVEAVKSANSDRKSSSASAEHETASGGNGARLGSSAGAGGGNHMQLVNGGVSGGGGTVKGSGGGGGGGGGGGTSDDSTAPQVDRPPLEMLNNMMASLTQEMDDRHLTILEVIGQGGFGVVYKGMWKGLTVAVKTITFQDRVAGGEKAQHRAILEAAISSSLAHPNVVTTYSYDIKPLTVQGSSTAADSCSNGHSGNGAGIKIVDKRTILDWKLYLIQEYCDGGSLRTAILKRKFFDTKKGEPRTEMILDTCLELTGGLVHLHERNIIHGDLNPNNVLLKRDASKKYGAVCKIADFGLSIKMGADQSHISNMRRGTPFYTCPQILARGNMTKAADVYSMGVMMWEMYHCCMSYRSLPSGFVARENFPNFPRKAPHEFARLVGSCLDNEPAQRPSFPQLRNELETQLAALKRGELRSAEVVLGPDPAGDATHMAACQD